MRVLVHEQFHFGHFYQYVHHLLPLLIDLVDEVIVPVPDKNRETVEFSSLIGPFLGRISIDSNLPYEVPKMTVRQRIRLHGNLRDAIRRIRPDYVFIPSADGQTSAIGFFRLCGLGDLSRNVPVEAGIHYGLGKTAISFRDRMKDALYYQTFLLSPWTNIHFVNAALYESIQLKGGRLARRAEMLPDPIPTNPRYNKIESRTRLNIPEDGRYIGVVGVLDTRKAIDKLLEAFRDGTLRINDRILLAGRLVRSFRELIERDYADMVKQNRIVLLNRYLDEQEFALAFSAVDVVCTPSPCHAQLSSVLLKGIAAGKPVLANDFGWSRMMIRRFQFGWTCNVLDKNAFARALRIALEQCDEYKESEATKRLLEFHSPENFAESWLVRLRKIMGKSAPKPVRSWDWVLEALTEEYRTIY